MLMLTLHSVVREFRQQHGGANHSKSWKTKIRGYDLFALFISDVFMVFSSIPALSEGFSNMLCITVEP